MIDLPPPSHEQTIEAISKCGVSRVNISIKYEGELQSDEVSISDLGVLSDEKLACVRAAVHPFYILTIRDQKQQEAFYDYSRRVDRPSEQAKALAWVHSKGLLDELPSYRAEQGLDTFSRALERVCGFKEGNVLEVVGDTTFTVQRDFLLVGNFKKSAEALECLMNMYAASDAPEKDIRFVFIGNEAFTEEKD